MHRNGKSNGTRPRARQSPQRRFRNGERAAVRRAVTAAQLYLRGDASLYLGAGTRTLAAAAAACGSNVAYVRAAVEVLRRKQPSLLADVLAGRVPLLTAAPPGYERQAASLPKQESLAEHFARCSREEWREAARLIGPGRIWDEMLVPVIA